MLTIEATVTDINRQTVSSRTTTLVHPAEFYIAAKPTGTDYFWRANTPQSIAVTTVRPDGEKVAGIRVDGTVARREWHRVRRERNGYSQLVGEWVTDTVAPPEVAIGPVSCTQPSIFERVARSRWRS